MKLLRAGKHVSKLSIDKRIFYRIYHILDEVITEVTVFELSVDPDNPRELSLTEIQPGEVSEELQEKIFSDEYKVLMTRDDKDLITNAMQTKYRFYQEITRKFFEKNAKVLQFIETGGHYFAFVSEKGAPFAKLFHLYIDPARQKVGVGGVDTVFLASLLEGIADALLSKLKTITIQIGEGVYTKLSLWENSTKKAVAMVAVAGENENGEEGFRLAGGFYLRKLDDGLWHVTSLNELEKKRFNEEIEKKFDEFYEELSFKFYLATGYLPAESEEKEKGAEV